MKIHAGAVKTAALQAVLWSAAVLLPVLLWAAKPSIVGSTYGLWGLNWIDKTAAQPTEADVHRDNPYLPFELFAFTGSAVLIFNLWRKVRKNRPATLAQAATAIGPTLAYLAVLLLVTELSLFRAWDYGCYEKAADALAAKDPIYTEKVPTQFGARTVSNGYLYPPLMAEVLNWAHQSVISVADSNAPKDVSQWAMYTTWTNTQGRERPQMVAAMAWIGVYYLYQCCQFMLACVLLALLRQLARGAGLADPWATVLAVVVVVVNTAMFRTLRHNQVNLWVLDLTLLAVLFLWRYPFVAGLLIAVAGHIKLYPLILLAPWAVSRRWLAIAGALVGIAAILAVQTGGMTDWNLWQQFIASTADFPKGEQLRDNSMHSLVFNTMRVLFGVAPQDAMSAAKYPAAALILVGVVWIFVRYVQRQRTWQGPGLDAEYLSDPRVLKLLGHSMDVMALMLLMSPLVWEHHYVLAMPVFVWAVAVAGRQHPQAIIAAGLLMFAVPTFDVYPFSYHRLAGLLMLLWATAPSKLFQEAGRGDFADANRPKQKIEKAASQAAR